MTYFVNQYDIERMISNNAKREQERVDYITYCFSDIFLMYMFMNDAQSFGI